MIVVQSFIAGIVCSNIIRHVEPLGLLILIGVFSVAMIVTSANNIRKRLMENKR